MNSGLQRLMKRIQEQDPELKQDYANSLIGACDGLIEDEAEAIVRHEVLSAEGAQFDADHNRKIVLLLEAKRALKRWRTPAAPDLTPVAAPA